MWLSYLYCTACEYVEYDLYAEYTFTLRNKDYCKCPECGEETSNIDKKD